MFAAFFSRSVAYSKNPRTPGGFFFDLETMKPLINNPGFVEALGDWVEATKYVDSVAQVVWFRWVWVRGFGWVDGFI